MADEWIIVRNWDTFQHYRDRRPPWIKVYLDLTHNEEFLELTGHERGVLLGLWLEYAASGRKLRHDTAMISRRLGLKVTKRTLKALNDAGFIEISASAALASRARTREKEKETDPPTPRRGARAKPRKPKTTGWRTVRGSHGMTTIPDPNGTDPAPPIGRPL